MDHVLGLHILDPIKRAKVLEVPLEGSILRSIPVSNLFGESKAYYLRFQALLLRNWCGGWKYLLFEDLCE